MIIMKNNTKILAVAIVAMFSLTAFAVLDTDNNDAASVQYHIYIQLYDDSIDAISQEIWIINDQVDQSKDSYINALKQGLDDQELSYEISASGWLSAIGDFVVHGGWDETYQPDNYYGFAIYYADGDEWKLTSTYAESNTMAVVFDRYLSASEYEALSDSEKEYYAVDQYMGYATSLPTVSTTAYETIVNIIMDFIIYIVVAIVVAVVIGLAIVIWVAKKKKTS